MHAPQPPETRTPRVRRGHLIVFIAGMFVLTAVAAASTLYNNPLVSPRSSTAVGASSVEEITVTSVQFKEGYRSRRASNCPRWEVRGAVQERQVTATHCVTQLAEPSPGDTLDALVAPYGSQALLTDAHTQSTTNAVLTLALSIASLGFAVAGGWLLWVLIAGAVTTRLGARPTPPGTFAKVYRVLR